MMAALRLLGPLALPTTARWLGLLTLASLSACHFGEIDGNGQRTDEVRDTAGFGRIRSGSSLDIDVVQGDHTSVVVSIDENLQEHVKVQASDDILYIETPDHLGDMVEGPHVLITVPELYAAKLAGSGRFWADLDQPDEPFDLFLTGSGEMSFRGRTAVVGGYLSGSGGMRLEGETGEVELELSGSGSIRAKPLSAAVGSIELSGSGDITATVESSVTVVLSGSGDIDLYGGASLDGYSKSGSGDVDQH
jgi:hypothetical protein